MRFQLAAGLLALALSSTALAQAVIESSSGDVRAAGAPVRQGSRLDSGAALTTGPKSRAQLRFENGMEILLEEGSQFRLVDFRRSATGYRVVLDLLSGAARIVTGEVTAADQFFLRTPQASFGVVGRTDFSVVLTDNAYVTVSRGTVTAAHRLATSELKPGPVMVIGAGGAAPAAATPTPAPVASAFGNLGAVAMSATQPAPRPADSTVTAAAPAPSASSAAPAADYPRFFIGASAGPSKIDDAVTQNLISAGTVDGKGTGFKVFAGALLHPNFGAEIAYVQLGELRYEGQFVGTPVTDGRFKAMGANLSAIGRLPLGESFSVFAKLGVLFWGTEAKDVTGGAAFNQKKDGSSASGGLGVAFDLTRNLALRAEAEAFSVAKERASLISLGLAVSF